MFISIELTIFLYDVGRLFINSGLILKYQNLRYLKIIELIYKLTLLASETGFVKLEKRWLFVLIFAKFKLRL